MIIKRFVVLLLLSVITTIGSGCHTTTSHFTKLPRPEEFKKPLQQLKQEYPDLTKYESHHVFGTVFDMPEAESLKDAWAEPHSTGFTPWMFLPTTLLFQPSEYWYWEFEGKTVSALIGRPAAFSYTPHVSILRVEEK